VTARRRWAARGSLAVYVTLLLLFTLAPFDFTWRPLVDGSLRGARVEWVPLTHACRAHGYGCLYDRVVNVLGFIPFGVLGALLPVRGSTRMARALRVTWVAFGLSFSIEAAQLLLPSRFPSTADVLLNAAGAWLGAMAAGGALESSRAGRFSETAGAAPSRVQGRGCRSRRRGSAASPGWRGRARRP
jgi:glycopeptide antibiotics resistance protein